MAVSLDPGQALVRSYLGKAYFEEKRTSLVEREYDVAKESDPKDPTPWPSKDVRVDLTAPAVDPDGDAAKLTYRWTRNGAPAFEGPDRASVPAPQTTKGDDWAVEVTASDGLATGLSPRARAFTSSTRCPGAPRRP